MTWTLVKPSTTSWVSNGMAMMTNTESSLMVKEAQIHLVKAVEGWLTPGRNPFGIYYNAENIDELAKRFGKIAEDKPWSMHEFAISDPDETFVRVGWATALIEKKRVSGP
jgi:hypothetical protein